MASHKFAVRLNIVFAATHLPEHPEMLDRLHSMAPSWGSWRSWQLCNTSNVICHDVNRARELLKRAMQAVCNFYIPQKLFLALDRPTGVRFYQGDFLEDVQDLEDIVAMHLVAPESDLILLFGFDISNSEATLDRLQQHRIKNRLGLIRHCISNNTSVQWVLIDHHKELDVTFRDISNLTCDNFQNMLKLLNQ